MKSSANHARAANLQRGKRYPSQPTFEEVEDEDFPGPDSHSCHNASELRHDDIIDDEELLDIIGCLRGTAMVAAFKTSHQQLKKKWKNGCWNA